jgi:deoxyadenosine/deoxycytidine kinase
MSLLDRIGKHSRDVEKANKQDIEDLNIKLDKIYAAVQELFKRITDVEVNTYATVGKLDSVCKIFYRKMKGDGSK